MTIPGLLLSLFLINPALVFQTEDPFAGSFSNQQYNIGVRIEKVGSGYGGEFIYQGERYPLTAYRMAGLLSGEYLYQGRKVSFTITRRGDAYVLTSEEVELPIVRTSSTPAPTGSAEQPSSSSSQTAGRTLLRDPQGAFTCEAPRGWSSTPQNGGFILRNSGTPVTIAITGHNESSIDEALAQTSESINNPAENTDIRVRARKLSNNTVHAILQGTARSEPVNLELLTVFSPYGGGLVVTVNYGNFSPNPEYLPIAESIATSARFTRSEAPPLARQWTERLRGMKLLFLQTDSIGSQRIDINLYADGRYEYQSNTGMMSQGGVGTGTYGGLNRQAGTWKVGLESSSPVLLLVGGGETTKFSIRPGTSGQQLLLNNRRWFLQPLP